MNDLFAFDPASLAIATVVFNPELDILRQSAVLPAESLKLINDNESEARLAEELHGLVESFL